MDTIEPNTTKIRAGAIRVEKYGSTRYWAIWLGEELLAVTVYKKGAMAIKVLLAEEGYEVCL